MRKLLIKRLSDGLTKNFKFEAEMIKGNVKNVRLNKGLPESQNLSSNRQAISGTLSRDIAWFVFVL